MSSKFSRRHSALSNVAQKKGQQAISLPVNLRTIVRVYFLDGTSKVLFKGRYLLLLQQLILVSHIFFTQNEIYRRIYYFNILMLLYQVLQMTDTSNIRDLLIALKFNLTIQDISTHAIFRCVDIRFQF